MIYSCTFLISFLLGPKLGHVVSVVCNQGMLTEINSWQRNVFSCNAFENNFNISESLFVVSFLEQGLQWKLYWLSKTFTSLRKTPRSGSWVKLHKHFLQIGTILMSQDLYTGPLLFSSLDILKDFSRLSKYICFRLLYPLKLINGSVWKEQWIHLFFIFKCSLC